MSEQRPPAAADPWRRWLGLLAGVVFVAQAWHYAPYLLDDAYISARYARNLAEGHGLVFNPGERVEGYTNLAWVVGAAGAIRLGADDPMLPWKCASALAAALLLFAVHRLERRLVPRPGPAAGRRRAGTGRTEIGERLHRRLPSTPVRSTARG